MGERDGSYGPERERAEGILRWAEKERGTGLSEGEIGHFRSVARAAGVIAEACGMDADKAYAYGLLHDIGKGVGVYGLEHVLAGYKILAEKMDWPEAGRIALTHTFYCEGEWERLSGEFSRGEDAEETAGLLGALEDEIDDYDRLIQLCDNIGTGWGVTTINDRFCDVLSRHSIPEAGRNLRALHELKDYFDGRAGRNIYELFREEIITNAMDSTLR